MHCIYLFGVSCFFFHYCIHMYVHALQNHIITDPVGHFVVKRIVMKESKQFETEGLENGGEPLEYWSCLLHHTNMLSQGEGEAPYVCML